MFDWLKHWITGLFGGGIGGAVAAKVVDKMGDRMGDIIVAQTAKVIEEDPRKEVVETILRLKKNNPSAAEVIMRRLETAAKTGKPDIENNVVRALGRMLPKNASGNVDFTEAERVFGEDVATLDDREFAVVVDALKHDALAQYIQEKILKRGGEGLRKFVNTIKAASSTAAFIGGVTAEILGELDRQAAEALPNMQQRIQAERARIAANVAKLRGGR